MENKTIDVKVAAMTFGMLILAIVMAGCHPEGSQQGEWWLWYDQPAARWNEALPVGR